MEDREGWEDSDGPSCAAGTAGVDGGEADCRRSRDVRWGECGPEYPGTFRGDGAGCVSSYW